jgi:hypothetical protein
VTPKGQWSCIDPAPSKCGSGKRVGILASSHLDTLHAEQSRLVARQRQLDAETAALEALLGEERHERRLTKEREAP